MLNIKMNKDEGQAFVQVKGTLPDVLSDLAFVFHKIRKNLDDDDKMLMDNFLSNMLPDLAKCEEEKDFMLVLLKTLIKNLENIK